MAVSGDKLADTAEKIFIGKGDQPAWLTLALGNRHGLVTGATGTGKTVSLQVMAEGFARAGVPALLTPCCSPHAAARFAATICSAGLPVSSAMWSNL